MAQSTPTNSYCSRASFRCAYMHHIEKYVFQQESAAPGSGLLLYDIKKKHRPNASLRCEFTITISWSVVWLWAHVKRQAAICAIGTVKSVWNYRNFEWMRQARIQDTNHFYAYGT